MLVCCNVHFFFSSSFIDHFNCLIFYLFDYLNLFFHCFLAYFILTHLLFVVSIVLLLDFMHFVML